MQTKQELRKKYNQIRATLSPEYRAEAHKKIFEKITNLPQVLNANTICCYVSHNEEVDTHQLINSFLNADKQVVIPKVGDDILKLYSINSLDDCIPGFKGILEPPESAPLVDSNTIDVFIILAIAYDSWGYRLGYGKGYTDRLLAGQSSGYRIGICYTDQLAFALPHEKHDIPVDLVISDSITLSPSFTFLEN